jgi:hypothetical protein
MILVLPETEMKKTVVVGAVSAAALAGVAERGSIRAVEHMAWKPVSTFSRDATILDHGGAGFKFTPLTQPQLLDRRPAAAFAREGEQQGDHSSDIFSHIVGHADDAARLFQNSGSINDSKKKQQEEDLRRSYWPYIGIGYVK